MGRITEELLRKRSEHNEGVLSTLKEITLHQFEIEKIELVGNLCRDLQILYLQNNLITKIENLHHLKELRYLNLAVNCVKVIENLETNECLEKLDLTVNFVEDLLCLENLKPNFNLREMHLIGNPCTKVEGYRSFVIHTLPQLRTLDGQEITKSERITAKQEHPEIRARLVEAQKLLPASSISSGSSSSAGEDGSVESVPEAEYDESGQKKYGYSVEERLAAFKELDEKRKSAGGDRTVDANKIGEIDRIGKDAIKKNKTTAEEDLAKWGRVLQKNEGGFAYKMKEDDGNGNVVLEMQPGKYVDTSLISVDVQPDYIRVEVKGRVLQLSLPEEVRLDNIKVSRSQTTGMLMVAMPKVNQKPIAAAAPVEAKKAVEAEKVAKKGELAGPVNIAGIVPDKNASKLSQKVDMMALSETRVDSEGKKKTTVFVDDDDVPPLE